MKSLVSVKPGRGRALLSLFAATCFAVALLMSAGPIVSGPVSAAAAEPTPIDMFLIAGQSNAVGYSPLTGLPAGTNDIRFDNVMYAAETNKELSGNYGTNTLSSFSAYVQAVKTGLGRSSSHMGPEFGIAEAVNDLYNGTDRKAIIFKSAAGGTSLLDLNSGESAKFGNWYPRSKWAAGYDPATRSNPTSNPTGVQYYNFVKNFEKVYNDLKANGYAPEVKGMFWMQGEADISSIETYRTLLTAFIGDIRADIAAITGNSADALMPFVVGEIAESFGNNTNNTQIASFNVMQREVAASLTSCSTVPTKDLIIIDPVTGQKNPDSPDAYHFSGKDARTLGLRAGNELVRVMGGRYAEISAAEHGNVKYRFDGDDLVVTLVPDRGYKVGSLIVNDADRTAELSADNVLTMATGSEKMFAINATFVKLDSIRIKREFEASQGTVTLSPLQIYEGDTVTATVTPKTGYRVKSVTFGGTEIAASEDGKYVLGAVTEDGTLKVEFERALAADASDEDKGGCGKHDLAFAFAALGALAAAMVIIKK